MVARSSRRRFGQLTTMRSGRWQARFTGHLDHASGRGGHIVTAPHTCEANTCGREAAGDWLRAEELRLNAEGASGRTLVEHAEEERVRSAAKTVPTFGECSSIWLRARMRARDLAPDESSRLYYATPARFIAKDTDDTLETPPLRGTQPPVVAAPFKYDVVNDHWEWSDALYDLHGYSPREIPATTDALISHKHPEDRERVAGVFAAAVQDGETYTCYHRIIDRNRRVLSVVSVGTTVLDVEGRTIEIEGYYIDLTAARRDETEVDVQEALTRKAHTGPLIEQAKGMIMLAEGCTADEAFDRLRTCSAHANRKLGDLARDLIETLAGRGLNSGVVSEVLGQLVNAARTAHVAKTKQGSSA